MTRALAAALAALGLVSAAPAAADERRESVRATAESTTQPPAPAPAGEAQPWAPARWIPPRPQVIAVRRIDDPPGLALEFGPGDDPHLEPREAGSGRLALYLPGVVRTATLPPVAAPFTDAVWKLEPGGATLSIGLESSRPVVIARAGQTWRVQVEPGRAPIRPTLAPSPEAQWAPHAEGDAATVALHRAVAQAHSGHGLAAIARLQSALASARPAPLRAAIHLVEARLALRESMLLLALDAAARASRLAVDPLARREAHHLLLRIEARLPGALGLVAHDITADALARALPGDEPLLFALGRALLTLDDPALAAEALRRAHVDRGLRDRARFLAHVAARLAHDRVAADAHLTALEASPTIGPATAIGVEVALARARRAYEDGVDAEPLYAEAAERAEAAGDAARAEAIRVERGWLALKSGRLDGLLESLLPLDLDAQGPRRALLVAALYHRACYPQRAAAVAGALIESVDIDPIGVQAGLEASIRKNSALSEVKASLARRVDAVEHRYLAMRETAPTGFWRRQARRTRISANARAAEEVIERMREGRSPLPDEPPLPGWRSGRWREAAPLPDRCPTLGWPPPLGEAKPDGQGDGAKGGRR